MKHHLSIVCLLATLTFASPTFADEVAVPNAEPINCKSYIVTPPQGWLQISGALTDAELLNLPDNIRDLYTRPGNSDVIFINVASPNAETTGNFKDSLNIVTISEKIPLTDDLVKELTNVLKSQYDTMFENFKLESAEKTKINDADALVFKGAYTIKEFEIKMEQYLYSTPDKAFVLTCSYNSKAEQAQDNIDACRQAVRSIKPIQENAN